MARVPYFLVTSASDELDDDSPVVVAGSDDVGGGASAESLAAIAAAICRLFLTFISDISLGGGGTDAGGANGL